MEATENELNKVQNLISSGKLKGQDEIGIRVGRVINKYKMAKHFILQIEDAAFSFERKAENISHESVLDGIYVILSSTASEQYSNT